MVYSDICRSHISKLSYEQEVRYKQNCDAFCYFSFTNREKKLTLDAKEHPGEAPTKKVDGLSDAFGKQMAHHHMGGAHEPSQAQGIFVAGHPDVDLLGWYFFGLTFLRNDLT